MPKRSSGFVFAYHSHEANASCGRKLELLANLVRIWIDIHAQARRPQLSR